MFLEFQFFTLLHFLVADYRTVFRTRSNTYNGPFFAKTLNGFSLLTIFAKKLHRRYLVGLKIGLWLLAKGNKILSLLLFQFYKLNWENTQPKNMCDIVFEKAEGRGETVNRTSVYAKATVRRAP